MTLSNLQIFNLYMWLRVPLHGDELIARNNFISLIKTQYDSFAEHRLEKMTECAEKDKDGKPVMEPGGNYKMTEEGEKKWKEYMAESVTYDLSTVKGKNTISIIKKILHDKPAKDLATEEGLLWQEVYDQL